MTDGYEWMHAADERILEFLAENEPDYAPLIANRLGMHLGYVEQRVDALVAHEFVTPVTGEVVYGLTDCGKAYLDDAKVTAPADCG